MSDLLNRMPLPNEVKKNNRWILNFPSSLGINSWTLASAQRPTINTNPVEIPFLNTSTYVAGRFTWNPITAVFRDPIGPSSSQALMEWIRLCSESVTGRQGYAVSYKRDVDLQMLDPNGVAVEKWILQGTWITDADFGSLSYDDDNLATITATLRMDRCILVY